MRKGVDYENVIRACGKERMNRIYQNSDPTTELLQFYEDTTEPDFADLYAALRQ